MIFERALAQAEPGTKYERIPNIIKTFTELIYLNVCRSLFEKDKLLFSLLMTIKVMEEKKLIVPAEKRFLMQGGILVEAPKPNPCAHWLLEKSWTTICELSQKLETFKGLDKEIEEHPLEWENVYNSKVPHLPEEEPWPGKWNNFDYFRKIIILRIL